MWDWLYVNSNNNNNNTNNHNSNNNKKNNGARVSPCLCPFSTPASTHGPKTCMRVGLWNDIIHHQGKEVVWNGDKMILMISNRSSIILIFVANVLLLVCVAYFLLYCIVLFLFCPRGSTHVHDPSKPWVRVRIFDLEGDLSPCDLDMAPDEPL